MLTLGLAVVFSAALAALLWRFPLPVTLAAVLVATTFDCFQPVPLGIDIGISVYVDDIACLVALVAGFSVSFRRNTFQRNATWPLLMLLLLAAVNFVRGATDFGIKPAGNGGRTLIYLIAPTVALMFLRPIVRLHPMRLARWLIGTGLVLSLIAGFRWLGVLPTPEGMVLYDTREVSRVLSSSYAIVLGQGLLAIIYVQITKGMSVVGISIALVFAVMTLVLQHRSVWGAITGGLIWFVARTARFSHKTWLQLGVSGLIGFMVLMAYSPAYTERAWSLLSSNIEETRDSQSTWSWRMQGYQEATARVFSGDLSEMLIGPPAGRDLGSNASAASTHIHNRYIDTLAYYGICGLILLLTYIVLMARRMDGWRHPPLQDGRDTCIANIFLQSLLLSQLIFFIPYFGELIQGVVLGLTWLSAVYRAKLAPRRTPASRWPAMRSSFPIYVAGRAVEQHPTLVLPQKRW